ncbi:hypothetical protein [Promicromonospora soli]
MGPAVMSASPANHGARKNSAQRPSPFLRGLALCLLREKLLDH